MAVLALLEGSGDLDSFAPDEIDPYTENEARPTRDRKGLRSHDRCDQMGQQRDQSLKSHEIGTCKDRALSFETVKTRTITISRIALANKVSVACQAGLDSSNRHS